MQTAVKEQMNMLKKHALQRQQSFPNQQTVHDAKIENEFFNDMKQTIYEQIAKENLEPADEEDEESV